MSVDVELEREREMALEIYCRCPSLSSEALKVLKSRGDGRRLRWLARQALREPEASWTDEERQTLLALAGEGAL